MTVQIARAGTDELDSLLPVAVLVVFFVASVVGGVAVLLIAHISELYYRGLAGLLAAVACLLVPFAAPIVATMVLRNGPGD